MFLLSTLLKFLVIWIALVVMVDGIVTSMCNEQTTDDEYMGCCTNECCQDLCVERGAMVYKKNVGNQTEKMNEEKRHLGWIRDHVECLCECCWLDYSYV
ncbi:hypothetical protein M3Y94_00718300 [Aphelenchoides besseyi]|nr:hypothetical protein M3Y94_00718300 [Aphelenchoides besseyi]